MDQVGFVEDRNTIRLEVRKLLEELLNQEEKIDQAARHKIDNQKRTILEGSQEWDILYRKYYNEEVKKLGVERLVSSFRILVSGRNLTSEYFLTSFNHASSLRHPLFRQTFS